MVGDSRENGFEMHVARALTQTEREQFRPATSHQVRLDFLSVGGKIIREFENTEKVILIKTFFTT